MTSPWRLGLALLLVAATDAFAAEATRAEEDAARALVEYQRGDFRRAAALFESAFAASQAPAMLNNAAKAHEKAGDLDAAIAVWTRYLALPGLPANKRSTAEDALAALKLRLSTVAPLADDRPVAPRPAPSSADLDMSAPGPTPVNIVAVSPPPASGPDVLGIVLCAAGGAILVAGSALYGSAWATHAAYEAGAEGREAQTVSRADADAAELRASFGLGGAIGGLLLLGAGVTSFLVLQDSGVELQVGPTGGAVSGRF